MTSVRCASIVIALFLGILPAAGRSAFAGDASVELRGAQELLAEGDYEKAFSEYRRFAEEKNNPLAQFTLGLFFSNGWHGNTDPESACRWFGMAAENGVPAAAHMFAECMDGGVGMQPDPSGAAGWYQKAADLGHLISLCSLGELYMGGRGVSKDPEKGIALCRMAADRGSVPAQIRVGRFFLEGDPAIRDYEQAFTRLSMAAEMGAPEAQYYVGVMLRDGLGGARQPQVARTWFERAAGKGYAPAYHSAGALYFNAPADPKTGKLSAHDLAKAYLWLAAAHRRTADSGEKTRNAELLERVLSAMPPSWGADLDAKVEKHLAAHPAVR